MKLLTKPTIEHDIINTGTEEKPNYFYGKATWNPVNIQFDAPLTSEKIRELTIDGFKFIGLIPLKDIGALKYHCVFDWCEVV